MTKFLRPLHKTSNSLPYSSSSATTVDLNNSRTKNTRGDKKYAGRGDKKYAGKCYKILNFCSIETKFDTYKLY